MIDSTSGAGNAPGLMASMMQDASARQNLQITLVKKAQDIEEAQGQSMLKLIESTPAARAGAIDVYA